MPAMALDDLARDLLTLAAATRDDPRLNETACAQASRSLAKALIAAKPADRELLARVARLRADRVDEWLADSIDLLETADNSEQRRLAAAARMETIGWAWAPEVPPMPEARIQALRDEWAAEHQLP